MRLKRPYRHPFYACLGIVLLTLLSSGALAQTPSTAWNWYFGDKAGITFQNGTAVSVADGQLQTGKGCASISDPVSGALLFYTDGVTVWNRLHEVMVNGTNLNGDAATSQSALIVPVPGSPSLFYVFNPAPVTSTNLRGRCFCLYYSIIDMRRDNGYGEVTTKNVHLFDDVTEHIAAVADCKNEGWWIVLRSRLTRHFYSFHVERGRINPDPVISDAGNPLLVVQDGGNMQISPDGRKLVITSTSGNSQLFDFDVSTGKVLNAVSLFPANVQGKHYGAAFSREGDRVYVAVSTDDGFSPAKIYQFHASAPSASAVQQSRAQIALLPNMNDLVPMQLAPDGNIYIGRPKQKYLARVSNANHQPDSIEFRDSAIVLTGDCRNGLPTFPSTFLGNGVVGGQYCEAPVASFDADSGCIGTCLQFTNNSVGRVDSYQWYFEGATPASSVQKNPGPVCYAAAGVFSVRLITRNPFGVDSAIAAVQIFPRPDVEVDSVLEICPGQSTRLRAHGAATYRWEPARTLTDPDSAQPFARPEVTTRYTVIGTGTNGCKDTASLLVRVRVINGGSDKTMCRGSEVMLDGTGADTYEWSPTTGLNDPSIARPLARPLQTTTYTVRLRTGTCDFLDTVVVHVVDTFSVAVTGATTTCPGVGVPVSVTGGATHKWWPTDGVADSMSGTTVITPRTTTTYYVEARSGSCIDTSSITIEVFDGLTVAAGPDASSCEGSPVILNAVVSTPTNTAVDVTWTPSAGLDTDRGTVVRAQPASTTTYIVTARSEDGCTAQDTVVISVKDAPSVSAGPDVGLCVGKSVQLLASGTADEYVWSPSTGLNDSTSTSPVASPAVTTQYILTGRTGGCVQSDTVIVNVSSLDLTVTKDTAICRGSSIVLQADGASRYTWSPPDGLSDATIATPIASPTTTTTYLVRGTDAYGCEAVKTVRVSLIDIQPIRLVAGNVAAQAGTENVAIPVFAEVDESMLPMYIESLSAWLVINVNTFFPQSVDPADRTSWTSSVRGTDRVTRFEVSNIQLVSPRQKIAEVRGTVLASSVLAASLRWEEVHWLGLRCPSSDITEGILYVSGCNLASRVLRLFTLASVTMQPVPGRDILSVDVGGNEPGTFSVRVVALDGRVMLDTPVQHGNNEVDMSGVGSGLYYVSFTTPYRTETVPLSWVR